MQSLLRLSGRGMSSMSSTGLAGGVKGKIAVVTASTDGIGKAIAHRLAVDGAKVMVSSRKQANVDATVEAFKAEGLTVEGVVCHVANEEHRKRLFDETVSKFGGVDILVSNAAVNPSYGPILEAKEEIWDKIWSVNVKASVLLVKEAYPHFIQRGGGSVVFVSSIAGYQAMEYAGVYSITKTALLGATKALASELAKDNIRVNCVAPGLIKTNFSSAIWKNETIKSRMEEMIPLGRMGVPEECAGAVSYLSGDDSKYVTGETLVIAGGMLSRL